MQRRGRGAFALAVTALALAVPAAALGGNGNGPKGDVVHVGDVKVKKPRKQDLPQQCPWKVQRPLLPRQPEESPPIGTVKIWPTINILTGGVSLSTFTLQGVGEKIEIWSPTTSTSRCATAARRHPQRDHPGAGELLHRPVRRQHRAEDVCFLQLAAEPRRHRGAARAARAEPVPGGLLQGPGQQDRHPDRQLPGRELLGHHLPVLRRGLPLLRHQHVREPQCDVDRLYDWAHRTGANPPNEPSTVLCQNRPAQPFKYEGVFAHEYQHLLEFWASPGEATWANEGIADYAITVTGYGCRHARSSRPATTATSRPSSGGGCCRRPQTRSRSRTAAPRTPSRCGTTRVGSRRSPTMERSTRSWSTWPAAMGLRS